MIFSIIIPTCNRNDLLAKCLDKLAPNVQTINAGNYEVIITDDSEANEAKTFIEANYSWAKWVEGPKRGPAANRNNGAKHGIGNWVVFIDDDCIPNNNLLQAYVNGIREFPNTFVFEGCTVVDRPQQRFNEEAPGNLTGGYLFSCNFTIKAFYFKELNGFDENFPYAAMEDTELAYRIHKLNDEFVFLKDAIIMHPWRLKKNPFRMTLKRFQSALYFVEKHPQEKNKLGSIYYLRSFYNSISTTFRDCLKFKFRGFFMKITFDFLQLFFAFYILFVSKKNGSITQKQFN